MSHPLAEIALTAAAYLIGSLSFATILVKLFRGVDIRELGSGNAGATNVLRTSGKKLALCTMLLDVAKAVAAVLLMRLATYDPAWLGAAAVAVATGHIFPVWFRFRGGKGVAPAIGAFAVLAPKAVLAVILVFFLVVAITRFVSLASVTAACLLPIAIQVVERGPNALVVAGAVTTFLLVVSHRANIRRLLDGTERKLGRKEPS